MRPVIEKRRFKIRYLLYTIILIICIISISIAIYMQFYRESNLGVIFGIKKENTDEEEIVALKSNFLGTFNNELEIIEKYSEDVAKLDEKKELITTSNEIKEQNANYIINTKIPAFNIDSEITKKYNEEIESTFLNKANSIITLMNNNNEVVYNVKYEAYLYKEILSLVIISELKEGENSQRIILQTYNYNLKENREININELLNIKKLTEKEVNNKIKYEIDKAQEQNIRLKEAGYNVNVRDSSSEKYKVKNAKTFFIGKEGYLYIVYPYGNEEFTSQIDLIIFK